MLLTKLNYAQVIVEISKNQGAELELTVESCFKTGLEKSIFDKGLRQFCTALSNNTSLTSLKLKNNNRLCAARELTPPSVFRQSIQFTENIVAALQKNTTLRKLHLENIIIREKESLLWSQFLSLHCNLIELALYNVYFTHSAAEIFGKSLSINTTIDTFSLSTAYIPGTYYKQNTLRALRDVLKSNHTIKVLIINQSLIGFDLDRLLSLLMRSPSIKFMELPGNKFFRCNAQNETRFIKVNCSQGYLQPYVKNRFLYQEISASEYETAKKTIIHDVAKNLKQNALTFSPTPQEINLTNGYLHDLENVSEYEHDYLDKEEANAYGLTKMLNFNLGSVIHIINSELDSIHCLLSPDKVEREKAAINYVKIITSFISKSENFQLKKPIVMLLNKTRPRTDASAMGNNHWVTAVILPKYYKTFSGQMNNATEIVYFIDSLYENVKLPEEFKKILTEGIVVSTENRGKDKIIARDFIPAPFPEAIFYDCTNIFQQTSNRPADSGWWAFYNALEIIYTGNIDFLNYFKGGYQTAADLRLVIPCYLRELYPYLKDGDNFLSSVKVKNPAPENVPLEQIEPGTKVSDTNLYNDLDDLIELDDSFLELGQTLLSCTQPNKASVPETNLTSNFFHDLEEIKKQKNLGLIDEKNQATSNGLKIALKSYLGDSIHIIPPELGSIHCLLSDDKSEREIATINYIKEITGFTIKNKNQSIESITGGVIHKDGGELKKPIVMLLNTSHVKPKHKADTTAVGGSHWVTAVILPKYYKAASGVQINNATEIIYFIDPLFKNVILPVEFKKALTQDIETHIEDEESGDIITTHEIKAPFPNAVFHDCVNIFQQASGTLDCGWWAFYNALEIIYTGSVGFLNYFKTLHYQANEEQKRRLGRGLRARYSSLSDNCTDEDDLLWEQKETKPFEAPVSKFAHSFSNEALSKRRVKSNKQSEKNSAPFLSCPDRIHSIQQKNTSELLNTLLPLWKKYIKIDKHEVSAIFDVAEIEEKVEAILQAQKNPPYIVSATALTADIAYAIAQRLSKSCGMTSYLYLIDKEGAIPGKALLRLTIEEVTALQDSFTTLYQQQKNLLAQDTRIPEVKVIFNKLERVWHYAQQKIAEIGLSDNLNFDYVLQKLAAAKEGIEELHNEEARVLAEANALPHGNKAIPIEFQERGRDTINRWLLTTIQQLQVKKAQRIAQQENYKEGNTCVIVYQGLEYTPSPTQKEPEAFLTDPPLWPTMNDFSLLNETPELFELLDRIEGTIRFSHVHLKQAIKFQGVQPLLHGENRLSDDLKEPLLMDVFEQQVQEFPKRIALIYENHKLSYEELNIQINRLAHYLYDHCSAGPNKRIGHMFLPGCTSVIVQLAILKAGLVYVPLAARDMQSNKEDKEAADARMNESLDVTTPSWIIVESLLLASGLDPQYQDKLIDWEQMCVTLEREYKDKATNLSVERKGPNLTDDAYVSFSSGTTGAPKAALNTHRGIYDMAATPRDLYALNKKTRFLGFASVRFDAHMMEYMTPLLVGGCLVIVPQTKRNTPALLADYIQEKRVTHAILVPAILRDEIFSKYQFPHLKGIISTGECLDTETFKTWSEKVLLSNGTGPNEVTVGATMGIVNSDTGIHVGENFHGLKTLICLTDVTQKTPDDNDLVLLTGQRLRYQEDKGKKIYTSSDKPLLVVPVPRGCEGEQFIIGKGIGKGYFAPQNTGDIADFNKKVKKLNNRFCYIQLPGGKPMRAFRTGDRFKIDNQGRFQIGGRFDRQTKINSVLLNAEELEARLKQHPALAHVLVLINNRHNPAVKILLELKKEAKTADRQAILRDCYFNLLPVFQQEAGIGLWAFVDELPRTSSKKINSNPDPEKLKNVNFLYLQQYPFMSYSNMSGPHAKTVQTLINSMQEILNLQSEALQISMTNQSQELGIYDNFFELGGDSMGAAKLIALLEQKLEFDINTVEFYREATVRNLFEQFFRKKYKETFTLTAIQSMNKRADALMRHHKYKKNTNENTTAIFFVHALTCNPKKDYAMLIEELQKNEIWNQVPIFGIHPLQVETLKRKKTENSITFAKDDEFIFTSNSLAVQIKQYTDAILLQRHIDYYILIGYSTGGHLAAGISQSLRQYGKTTASYCLDGIHPQALQSMSINQYKKFLEPGLSELIKLKGLKKLTNITSKIKKTLFKANNQQEEPCSKEALISISLNSLQKKMIKRQDPYRQHYALLLIQPLLHRDLLAAPSELLVTEETVKTLENIAYAQQQGWKMAGKKNTSYKKGTNHFNFLSKEKIIAEIVLKITNLALPVSALKIQAELLDSKDKEICSHIYKASKFKEYIRTLGLEYKNKYPIKEQDYLFWLRKASALMIIKNYSGIEILRLIDMKRSSKKSPVQIPLRDEDSVKKPVMLIKIEIIKRMLKVLSHSGQRSKVFGEYLSILLINKQKGKSSDLYIDSNKKQNILTFIQENRLNPKYQEIWDIIRSKLQKKQDLNILTLFNELLEKKEDKMSCVHPSISVKAFSASEQLDVTNINKNQSLLLYADESSKTKGVTSALPPVNANIKNKKKDILNQNLQQKSSSQKSDNPNLLRIANPITLPSVTINGVSQQSPIIKIVTLGDTYDKDDHLRLFFDGYYDPHQPPVIGADFKTFRLSTNLQDFRIQVWLTCALERFDKLNETYLQRVGAVLICASLKDRNNFIACIKRFLPMIEKSAPKAIRVLVGINLDLRVTQPDMALSEAEAIELARQFNIDGYFECSAKTGEGIDDAFNGAFELAIEKLGLWARLGETYIPSPHVQANKLAARTTYDQISSSLQKPSRNQVKEEKASSIASYKFITEKGEDFHYVHLKGALNPASQKTVKRKYGLDSPSLDASSHQHFFSSATTDNRKKNQEALSINEIMDYCHQQKIEGFKSIAMDGNCFFRSVLAALGEDEDNHPDLRERAIRYIQNNRAHFNIEGDDVLDDYLDNMRQDRTWADGPIIEAVGLVLNIQIDVIQMVRNEGGELAAGERFTAAAIPEAPCTILLLRVNDVHYHATGCPNVLQNEPARQLSPR